MNVLLDLTSVVLIVIGSFFVLSGGLGLLRLPDFFSRTHVPGLIDTVGAAAILLGFAFQTGFDLTLVKLALVLIFVWITGPTAAHALGRTALRMGIEPETDGRGDEAPKC